MRASFDESDLLRLIEGDCSPDEAVRLQAWVAADSGRTRLLDELRAVWRATGGATRRWDRAAALERLRRARIPYRAWSATWWVRLAAGIALLLLGGVTWQLMPRGATFRDHLTLSGEPFVFGLPDGTRVILGEYSRLRVPHDFHVTQRVVELSGEARFVVRHDAARPFVVRTRHGSVEDLGTEFTVRAYPGENLDVVVVAGAVALRTAAGSRARILRPGDRGVIDASGTVSVTRHDSSPSLHIALADTMSGQWVFLTLRSESTARAEEAVAALARRLGMEVAWAGASACLSRPDSSGRNVTERDESVAGPRVWRCPAPYRLERAP